MTKLQFDPQIQAYDRQPYRPSLEDLQKKLGLDVIYQLSQNENPLGPSPKVLEAIEDVSKSLSYYPNFSDFELRDALVDVIGRGITPDHIYTGCSGYESLEMICRGFLRSDDEVIVSSPTFTGAYGKISSLLGAKMVDVPLYPETFVYDVDGVLAAITDKTKMIMLCNPNNPTGTLMTAAQMDKLMSQVPEHVLVVSDEVYHHFVEDADYPDSLQYVIAEKNIVLVHSFSKAYGLAGLRLGYGIARPEIANYLSGLHRGFHQNKVTLAAGIAATKDQDYLKEVVAFIKQERNWLLQELDRLDIRYWKPAANYILMETPLPAEDLANKLKQRGIIIRPQDNAGFPCGIRLSIGTHEANMAFIHALEEILSEG